ncbi:MAG: serine/threonine-protein kinase, partial [Myxococcota bacterium]
MSLVGQTLGKYAIDGEVGHGGMSVVYRARDIDLKRDVAVKVMHTFLAEQAEARERFHREAIAVARLRHRHIIEVYDYSGEEATHSYIVQELVEGSSLAEFLNATPLREPELALILARPIADALAHAHESGVVHRDLKPENILVGQNGALKLTDFGIARMLDNQTLTVTGTLLGS